MSLINNMLKDLENRRQGSGAKAHPLDGLQTPDEGTDNKSPKQRPPRWKWLLVLLDIKEFQCVNW